MIGNQVTVEMHSGRPPHFNGVVVAIDDRALTLQVTGSEIGRYRNNYILWSRIRFVSWAAKRLGR